MEEDFRVWLYDEDLGATIAEESSREMPPDPTKPNIQLNRDGFLPLSSVSTR
jgi:hypothetical protein